MVEPPAHRLLGPAVPTSPVILSVPHAGRVWTEAMRALACHDIDAMRPLEDRHADRLIERAVAAGHTALVADTPRAWVDLNRAPDDLDWPRLAGEAPQPVSARAAAGIGIVPDRLPDLGDLWRAPPGRAEVARRVAQTHAPYHAALERLLAATRARFGEALLLDVHSMPAVARGQADLVLGTKRGQSVAAHWVAVARESLIARNRRVAVDRPYSGAHIAERHGRPAKCIHVLQLELCRSTHLDGAMVEIGAGLARCQEDVAIVAAALASQLSHLTDLPVAAE